MNTPGTPIVFFGNERIATGVHTTVPTLRALINAGYDIKAVVSNYETGTSRNIRELEVQVVAEAHNIPLLLPGNISDIEEQLKSYGAQVGILVAYGKIVPQEIIDMFPRGIVNIHPSLLPLHRGPTPLESVILSGESQTGVSVMALVKAMDAGPVYGQNVITLDGTESKQELAEKLITIGSEMIITLLPEILDVTVVPKTQNDAAATYDKRIIKSDGIIEWTKPAAIIEREIRAFAVWPKSVTVLAGKDVTVCAVRVIDEQGTPGTIEVRGSELIVYCATGALILDTLKPAGKSEMTGQAFLAGYKHLL